MAELKSSAVARDGVIQEEIARALARERKGLHRERGGHIKHHFIA